MVARARYKRVKAAEGKAPVPFPCGSVIGSAWWSPWHTSWCHSSAAWDKALVGKESPVTSAADCEPCTMSVHQAAELQKGAVHSCATTHPVPSNVDDGGVCGGKKKTHHEPFLPVGECWNYTLALGISSWAQHSMPGHISSPFTLIWDVH